MIPFTDKSSWEVKHDMAIWKRIQKTVAFIDDEDIVGKQILDIGESSLVSQELEKRLGINLHHTLPCDFNFGLLAPIRIYDTIFSFEVLEHVMNVAFHLQCVASHLKKNGILYLSTPVRNPFGFWANQTCHFSEYDIDKVVIVANYAGFNSDKVSTFRSLPFIEGYRRGAGPIRGTLRIATHKQQLHKFVKR